jgi:hypothetical protein
MWLGFYNDMFTQAVGRGKQKTNVTTDRNSNKKSYRCEQTQTQEGDAQTQLWSSAIVTLRDKQRDTQPWICGSHGCVTMKSTDSGMWEREDSETSVKLRWTIWIHIPQKLLFVCRGRFRISGCKGEQSDTNLGTLWLLFSAFLFNPFFNSLTLFFL